MISNHLGMVAALRPVSEEINAQTLRFLESGGEIFIAPQVVIKPKDLASEIPVINTEQPAESSRFLALRKVAKEKEAFVDKVREMAKTMTQRDITQALGITRKRLFSLGEKHGFTFKSGREQMISAQKERTDRSQDAVRIERILAFKEIGLTRTQAAKQMVISNTQLLRLLTDYKIDYPKAVNGFKK
jgi:hypothetical protein